MFLKELLFLKKIWTLIFISVLGLVLTGCSNSASNQVKNASQNNIEIKKDKVALIYAKNQQSYFESLAQMLVKENFEIENFPTENNDSISQDNSVKKISDKGYRFLIIDAINRSQMNSSLDHLRGQGTNIIGYDNTVYKIGAPDVNITFNYSDNGVKAANKFIEDQKIANLPDKKYKTLELFAGNVLSQSNYDYFKGVMQTLQPYIDNGKIKILSKQLPQNDGENISSIAVINNDKIQLNNRLEYLLNDVYKNKQPDGIILGPNIELNTEIKIYNTNIDKDKYSQINKYTISLVLALKNHTNIDNIPKISNGKRMIPTVYVY